MSYSPVFDVFHNLEIDLIIYHRDVRSAISYSY